MGVIETTLILFIAANSGLGLASLLTHRRR